VGQRVSSPCMVGVDSFGMMTLYFGTHRPWWGGALGIHGYGNVDLLLSNSVFEDNAGLYGGVVDFEIGGTLYL
jgi:hypothetical protein